jgi:hypothetical protein
MKRNAIVLALGTLLFAVGFLPARSQTIGAQAEGKVTQDGSPFPNAPVVFTNTQTGKIYKTKTEKNSEFRLLGVPYGSYEVNVLNDKGKSSLQIEPLWVLTTQRTAIFWPSMSVKRLFQTISSAFPIPLLPSSPKNSSPKSQPITKRSRA